MSATNKTGGGRGGWTPPMDQEPPSPAATEPAVPMTAEQRLEAIETRVQALERKQRNKKRPS